MNTNLKQHLKTIMTHRKFVKKACFKMGIPLQGFLHDLSKYTRKELLIYKYANGQKSPHAVMRDQFGYSDRWMYHYHKNKHHWQYWLDIESYPQAVYPIKMPYKYVIEMFCDFIGAGKAYNKEKWTLHTAWDYWMKACENQRLMHPDSEYLIKKLLWNLHEAESEECFYSWYNSNKDYIKKMYELGILDQEETIFSAKLIVR